MRSFLLFLVFLSGINNSFAQDVIEVRVEINIEKHENQHASSKFYQIELYALTDTFHLETDGKGFIKLSNRDEIGILKMNQTYRYVAYKGDRWIGEDNFNTNVNQSTRIIRELKELTFTCGQTYDPISFIGESLELTAQGKIDFQHLSNFLEDQENIVLELYGQSNTKINGLLALERANKIRDSLIFEGHFPDRLKIHKPIQSEREATVDFGILSFNYTPCTGGSVINFDKKNPNLLPKLVAIHFSSLSII